MSKDKATKNESQAEVGGVPMVRSEQFLALRDNPAALLESLRANVGDGAVTPFDLDRVRVPAGGGLTWQIPGLVTTEDRVIDGVIVAWRDPRAYWREGLDSSGGGTPPDCSSNDGRRGSGDPGGECAACPLNQFGTSVKGSEHGRGKACKESRLLFVLREGDRLPIVLSVPPSSLKPVRQFFLRLASRAMPYWSVVTRFELQKERSKDGISYSQIAPSLVAPLDPDAARGMKSYADGVAPVFAAVPLERADVRAEA